MSGMSSVSAGHPPETSAPAADLPAAARTDARAPAPPPPPPDDRPAPPDVPPWGEWFLLRLASAAERAFEELTRAIERFRKDRR